MKGTIASMLEEFDDVLHRIRVKLYPNQLTKIPGKYIARTSNEKTLSVEEVCAALKSRGGFEGDHKEVIKHVKLYFKECVYQLCDGFAVNTGFFTVYPNVGGTFDSAKDEQNSERNPVSFRFRTGLVLKAVARRIQLLIEGVAQTNGYIHRFYDVHTESTNDHLTGNSQFVISGDRIKVAGDPEECGVFFELIDEENRRIKVQQGLAVNTPSKVVGVAPMLLAPKSYRVVIVTQYSPGGGLLKKPKTIISNFELDVA